MTKRFPNWDEIWTDNNPFGKTLFGDWSLAELQELIDAKDKEFQVLDSAYANTQSSQWPNPQVQGDWVNDWTSLKSRYNQAKSAALNVISIAKANFLAPPLSMTTAEPYYSNVIHALKQNPNTITKGDLDDVHQRLNAIKPIPTYTVPQPSKANDFATSLSQVLAPLDPIGDVHARANWTKDLAIGVGASLIGGLILLSLYKKV
jgi:hypothetical protein